MNINHLRYFVAVVEHKSISRAADAMNVSQPAVSNSIRLLEHVFDAQLLDRGPRGVSPTAFGKTLLEFATAATSLLDRAGVEIQHIKDGSGGHLNLGVVGSAVSTLTPRIICDLVSDGGAYTFDVSAGNSEPLLARLYAGDLDVILAGHTADFGLADEFIVEELLHAETQVFARKGHPLTRKKRISVGDLQSAQWVLPEKSLIRRTLGVSHSPSGKDRLDVVLTTNSMALIAEMVKASDLLTSSVADALKSDLASGAVKPLEVDVQEESWKVSLIYLRNRHLTKAMLAFIAKAKALASSQ